MTRAFILGARAPRRSAAVNDQRPPEAARESASASLTARTAWYPQGAPQARLLSANSGKFPSSTLATGPLSGYTRNPRIHSETPLGGFIGNLRHPIFVRP